MLDSIAIGQRIYQAMKEKGMNQQELSEAVYADKSVISKYIRGGKVPTIYMLMSLCEVLEKDPNYFLLGKEEQR